MTDKVVIVQESTLESEKEEAIKQRYCFRKCTKRQFFLWSICCGVCTAIILIVVLVLLFAVAPAVAQSAMDASVIEVEDMEVANSTKDSMTISMKFNAWNTYALDVMIPSPTVKVTYGGDVLGTMKMPNLKLHAHGKNSFEEKMVLNVEDMNIFDKYSAALITNRSIEMGLSGHVHVNSLGLDFALNMNKVVSLKGFNNFNSISATMKNSDDVDVRRPVLKSIEFEESKASDVPKSIILVGTAEFPNPSQLTIVDGGILDADVYAFDKKVGIAKSSNNIRFGVNGALASIRMTVTVFDDNKDALRRTVGNYINGVTTRVVIQGTGSSLSLWSGAMKYLKVAIDVPGLVDMQDKIFQGIQSPLNLSSIALVPQDKAYCAKNFGQKECDANPTIGKTIPMNVVMRNVLGIDVNISDYSLAAYLASQKPEICLMNPSYCSNIAFNYTGTLFAKASPYKGSGGYWPQYPQPFGEKSKGYHYPATVDQVEIRLAKKSTLKVGIAACSALAPLSIPCIAFLGDLISPFTKQMRKYPAYGGNLPWFYGQDSIPIEVDVNGTGTVKTNSGFELDGVYLFQNGVRVWISIVFPMAMAPGYQSFMYGAPVMQSYTNEVGAVPALECSTVCTKTKQSCTPSQSNGNFVMTCKTK